MKVKIIPTGPILANCYVVFDENSHEAAVIDPGSFDSSVRHAVKGLNVKYIICTHGHYDHILGAGDMIKETGAKLLIHTLDEECLSEAKANLIGEMYPGKTISLKADRLLEDGDKIEFGGITLEVMHTPGHSRGSITLINRENRLLFTGDTLFSQGVGRTDFYGSEPDKMLQSIKKIMSLEGNYHILPGHNEDCFLDDERMYYR